MQQPPIIFLAFANDFGDYLHQLTEEQDEIRNALKPMEDENLCEVVLEPSADLDKIWRTFNEYQDRIAIFHYGGHAEDYSLLLKKSNGEQQVVNGEGLVSFLGRQKGLQLAFINGCSSKRQAEELRDKGVPAVIGTSEPIDDSAATLLAKTFYEAIARGRSIQQSWLGAKDRLISDQEKNQQGYYRSIGRRSRKRAAMMQFPWELYIRSGAELVESWNLPQAARNPLFGLPLPEEMFRQLPKAPYVGLQYFQEKDAAIFYGRGGPIRKLYNHIKGIHPIILLYGKSGVGKSSMLGAGLVPRIKDQYQIIYLRRKQELGLLGTLDQALDEMLRKPKNIQMPSDLIHEHTSADLDLLRQTSRKLNDLRIREAFERLVQELERQDNSKPVALSGILKKWHDIEQEGKQALIVILDQVEEKFTRPIPMGMANQQDELLSLLKAIQPLFSGKSSGIGGKIILSYRKEYHPEIRDAFQSLSLPYAEFFLKRLDRYGIIEAIRACTLKDQKSNGKIVYNPIYNPYRLELEQNDRGNLPEIIADDLMEDPESPIAPVLQIILKKLWETAPKQEGEPVRLGVQQYQELRKQGTSMSEFFHQQMQRLGLRTSEQNGKSYQQEIQQAVESGLVLDILYAHTTSKGTAGSCAREALLQRYNLEEVVMIQLLQELVDLSLLNQSKEKESFTTYLAHDTLAPIVSWEFNLSNAPGQQAARTLANEMTKIGFQLAPEMIKKWEADAAVYKIKKEELIPLKKEYTGFNRYLHVCRNALGGENFELLEDKILLHTVPNFMPDGLEVFLEEGDLVLVETGIGEKGQKLPGMRMLSKVEEALLLISQEKRLQRQQARRDARKEKERFAQELLERSKISYKVIYSLLSIPEEEEIFQEQEQIRIGMYDEIVDAAELEAYLRIWHAGLRQPVGLKFRQDLDWMDAQTHGVEQHVILALQLFLVESGFLHPMALSGIFGYETLSAIRQFQEYNYSSFDDYKTLPDGLLSRETWAAISKWKKDGTLSDFNSFSNNFPSATYNAWLDLLKRVKNHKSKNINEINRQINQLRRIGDTRKIADWSTSSTDIHLLCIRRNEQTEGVGRAADDLFVLLIKGQTFIFWGSTDPGVSHTTRPDEAYLVEGQHQFQFGWYNSKADFRKTYRAITPKHEGVLVVRDRDNDNKLTASDIAAGLDPNLNQSIRITWTGDGRRNWSQGNLVIAGRSYLNHHGRLINCAPYAAIGSVALIEEGKTMGAYYSLVDLLTILSNNPNPDIIVTLINETDLALSEKFTGNYAAELLGRLQGGMPSN